jgi:phosphate-selective porin
VGSQLAPGRDVGVMARGRVFGKRASYEAGFFRRDGDNARTSATRGGADAFAGRLRVAPFASKKTSPFASLEIGAAATRSRVDEQLGLRGRTVFGEGVFFDRVYVNGTRIRRGLEAGWALGPFSVSGEYISVSDERVAMGLDGEALPSVRSAGWYLAGTWTVTGEEKDGRIIPRRDFLRGGFGAIELAARMERFGFDDVPYPGTPLGFPAGLARNGERATTLGVTWYVNRFLKTQANLVIEAVDDPQRSPASASDGRFTSGVFLFQFAL